MKTLFPLFLFLILSIGLNAQIFVNLNASGNNDGSSWNNAYTDLQTAIDNAQEGDALWIAEGVYKPQANVLPDSNWYSVNLPISLYGGFNGTETMLNQRDWVSNSTILSGDINGDDVADDFNNFRTDNAIHVLRVGTTSSSAVVIDGLSVTGGNAKSSDAPTGTTDQSPWRGGGMEIIATAEIRNCNITQCNGNSGSAFWANSNAASPNDLIFENNRIENNRSQRGAMVLLDMTNPTLSNCHIVGNANDSDNFGGGLTIGNSNAIIQDCTFENNEASNSLGGGMFIYQNSQNNLTNPSIEIRRSNFIGNSALAGGALTFNNFYPNSSFLIDSCHFFQNKTTTGAQGAGGAIVIQNIEDSFGGGLSTLSATISNSTIEANTAYQAGGVFLWSNAEEAEFVFSNTDFINNVASNYAGALNIGNTSALVEDCTFQGNESTTSLGAGIFIWQNSQNVDPTPIINIKRSSFLNNDGRYGGGITFNNYYSNSSLSIDSCHFFQNKSIFNGSGGGALLIQNLEDSFGGGNPSLSLDIANSNFEENEATSGAAAYLYSESDIMDIHISNSNFLANTASEMGGGLYIENDQYIQAIIQNSTFTENEDGGEGAAIVNIRANTILLENVLLNGNTGAPTISNDGNLSLRNVSMVNNDLGLNQKDNGTVVFQNCILANEADNYLQTETSTASSRGGNICSDNTLETVLLGYNSYLDYNNMSPDLDTDLIPTQTSLSVDAGNPDNITSTQDLAGNDRIQGTQIDIGAFESPFMLSSVRGLNNKEIQIYPNPFINYLNLSDIEGIKGIRLLDVLGKEVQRFEVAQQLFISEHLNAGVYFLELDFGSHQVVEKMEKTR